MTAAKNLRPGDRIVCPGSGRVERVTSVRRLRADRVHVRTDAHDHPTWHPERDVEVQS